MKTSAEMMVHLQQLKSLYLRTPTGVTDAEAALLLRLPRSVVYRYRRMLHVLEINHGRYTAVPLPDEVEFAEAVLWRLRWERRTVEAYRAADDADERDAAD